MKMSNNSGLLLSSCPYHSLQLFCVLYCCCSWCCWCILVYYSSWYCCSFIFLLLAIVYVPVVLPWIFRYIVAGCIGSKRWPSIAKSGTARITSDQVIDLHTIMHYLDVPVKSRGYMFGDNKYIFTSSAFLILDFYKQHNYLSCNYSKDSCFLSYECKHELCWSIFWYSIESM